MQGNNDNINSNTEGTETAHTGAVRSKLYPTTDHSKFAVRLDLLFQNDVLLRRLGQTYAEGALKYKPGNWMLGFDESVYLAHALEHIRLYMAGDTSEDHLAHACWNFGTLMWVQENKPELMDLHPVDESKPHSVYNSAGELVAVVTLGDPNMSTEGMTGGEIHSLPGHRIGDPAEGQPYNGEKDPFAGFDTIQT